MTCRNILLRHGFLIFSFFHTKLNSLKTYIKSTPAIQCYLNENNFSFKIVIWFNSFFCKCDPNITDVTRNTLLTYSRYLVPRYSGFSSFAWNKHLDKSTNDCILLELGECSDLVRGRSHKSKVIFLSQTMVLAHICSFYIRFNYSIQL